MCDRYPARILAVCPLGNMRLKFVAGIIEMFVTKVCY
jgi:hypothetical protein